MANAFNTVSFVGRIPSTDKLPFNFTGKDDPSKSFMNFMISVRRAYKPKDAQYYEEDLIPVKTWGHTANFIHDYVKRGDTVAITGELRRDADWEDNEGNTHRGQLSVYADNVRSIASKNNGSSESDDNGGDEAPAKKPASHGSLAARLRNRRSASHI